jgi:serine/threonine protein kinase
MARGWFVEGERQKPPAENGGGQPVSRAPIEPMNPTHPGDQIGHCQIEKLVARSDLYSLGVMLYEMLTGKVVFQGPNPFAIMNDRLLNNPVSPAE